MKRLIIPAVLIVAHMQCTLPDVAAQEFAPPESAALSEVEMVLRPPPPTAANDLAWKVHRQAASIDRLKRFSIVLNCGTLTKQPRQRAVAAVFEAADASRILVG